MIYIYKDKPIQIRLEVMKGNSAALEDFSRAKVWMFLLGNEGRILLSCDAHDGVIVANIAAGTLEESTYSIDAIWCKNWNRFGENTTSTSEKFLLHDLCDPETFDATHHQHPTLDHGHLTPFNDFRNEIGMTKCRVDYAFGITQYADEDNTGVSDLATLKIKAHAATYGYDGLDAYQLAVVSGRFIGSEDEWYSSLKGKDGTDGTDGKDGNDTIDYDKIFAEVDEQIALMRTQLLTLTRSELDTTLAAAKTNLANALATLDQAKADLDEARELLDSLQESTGDEGFTKKLAMVSAFADWYDKNAETVTNLAEEIDAINATITLHGEKLDTIEGTIGDVSEILNADDGSITSIAKWIDNAKGTLTNLQTRLASAEGTIISLGTYTDTNTGNVKSVQQELSAIEAKITSQATETDTLNKKVTSVSETLDAIEAKVTSQATETDALNEKLTSVSETLDAHKATYETKVTTLESGKVNVSEFQQLADKVSIVVKSDSTPNIASIIAAINGDTSSVKINANKITLDGDTFVKYLDAYEGILGSGVFKGDYFFSKYGVDSNGNATTEYSNFNVNDPYGSTSSFMPNWCVNLKTGEMWASGGKVSFSTDGSGQIGDGNINWGKNGSGLDIFLSFLSQYDQISRNDLKSNIGWYNADYYNDRYITLPDGVQNTVSYSTDGLKTFSTATIPSEYSVFDVAVNDNGYYILGYPTVGNFTVYKTTDFSEFTAVYSVATDLVYTDACHSRIYNAGGKVIVMALTASGKWTVASTTDGTTWTTDGTNVTSHYGADYFMWKTPSYLYVKKEGTIELSKDGVTWVSKNFAADVYSATIKGVVENDGKLYVSMKVIEYYSSVYDCYVAIRSTSNGGTTWYEEYTSYGTHSSTLSDVEDIQNIYGLCSVDNVIAARVKSSASSQNNTIIGVSGVWTLHSVSIISGFDGMTLQTSSNGFFNRSNTTDDYYATIYHIPKLSKFSLNTYIQAAASYTVLEKIRITE